MKEQMIARYIEVVNQLKELEKEKDFLREEIMDEIKPATPLTLNGFVIKKSVTSKPTLKEGVELSQLVEKLGGGAIKQTVNMDFLKSSPEAFEFLTMKEEVKFLVTKEKKTDVVQE